MPTSGDLIIVLDHRGGHLGEPLQATEASVNNDIYQEITNQIVHDLEQGVRPCPVVVVLRL